MKKEIKLSRNPLVALGLNKDGSEVVDTTVRSVSLGRFMVKSADQKLKEMLDRELAKAKRADETVLDAYDFELEDDSPNVMLHHSVEVNPLSKREIVKEYHEQKKRKKAAKDAAAESAKGPSGGPASLGNGKSTNGKDSARGSATEGAESSEED